MTLYNVRVKTREELRADGWLHTDSSSPHAPRGTPSAGYAESMFPLMGDNIPILLPWYDENDWRTSSGYAWTPAMLRMRRVRTEAEFIAAGWREHTDSYGTRYLLSPESGGPSKLVDAWLGSYIPVLRRRRSDGVVSTFLEREWVDAHFADEAVDVPAEDPRPLRERVVAFRDAGFEAAMASVTCGFELETQLSEGQTWSMLSDEAQYDRPAIRARAVQLWEGRTWAYQFERLLTRHSFATAVHMKVTAGQGTWKEVCGYWITQGVTDYAMLLAKGWTDEADWADRLEECLGNEEGNLDWSQYRLSDTTPAGFFKSRGLDQTIEVGQDGSVRGFEFRTLGGLTPERFATAAKTLFALEHVVDVGCSFHIHVQVKGIKHKWGERMQQALTEYLVEHINEAPASVRQRWATIDQRRHLVPKVSAEKFTFVHAHPQGTWEFRCFGNVKTAADADVCLRLAVHALQHAYCVTTGAAWLTTDAFGLTHRAWADLCASALSRGETLSQAFAARPEHFEPAA